MPFTIINRDITSMQVDAIVNAANPRLAIGGGVCGAIHAAAGPELERECLSLGGCETGKAKITGGYDLPSRFVIHAVGPVWQGGNAGEEKLLRSCYRSSLQLAEQNGLSSVAFPLISGGIYGYPPDEALRVACDEIWQYLLNSNNDLSVTLCLLGKHKRRNEAIDRLLRRRKKNGPAVIFSAKEKNAPQAECLEDALSLSEISFESAAVLSGAAPAAGLPERLKYLDEPFSVMLLQLIDEKGYSDSEVYKRANLDRKLFSKIRSDRDYKPSKRTVLALAFGLRLDLPETEDLLRRAGFSLSDSQTADVIVKYFLEQGETDLHVVNTWLFEYDQVPLGSF